MDIKQELLKEHSKAQTMKIVNYIGTDTNKFEILMELFFHSETRVVQRASSVMNYVAEHHHEMIFPYLYKMVENINTSVIHDAVKRNTLRIFQFIEIPENLYGKLINICFECMSSHSEAIAIKVFSMTVLSRICYYIPEIKNELRILIEDQLPYGSAGFKNRGNKILRELNIMNK